MTVKKHFHHCCMFNAISTLRTCSKSFLTFSLLILCFHFRSKTSSKWPFPQQESQLYFGKTDETAAQYRNHTARKNLSTILSLPMSNSSSFKETYLHGKSVLSPSVLEESGCDLGKLLWGILAPASPEDGLHSEAWSLLGKHHPVTCAQFSTFLVIKALVLASSYVVLVFIMQDCFARNIS